MSHGLKGWVGRGPVLSERVAACIGAALLALVVGTILLTFVLLLVRKSATPSAVEVLRPGLQGAISSSPRARRSSAQSPDSIRAVRRMRRVR